MFKVLLVILGLAAYGAYTLLNNFSKPAEPAAAVESQRPSGLASLAMSAVEGVTGLSAAPLPPVGCQENATLSRENMMALLDAMPEAQRETLLYWLTGDKVAMPMMQPYLGEQGLGVCLPAQDKVILLPAAAAEVVRNLIPPRN